MSQPLNRVLVIKMFYPMVKAVAMRNINVVAFGIESGVESQAEADIVRSLPKNVKYIPLNFRRNRKNLGSLDLISKVTKLVKNETPDIIHVNALQDLLLTYLAVHSTISAKKRPAIVAMAHNPNVWSSPRRARQAASAIRFFADGFAALATTNMNQLIGFGIPSNRLAVIPNPFDLDQLKAEINVPEKPIASKQKSVRIIYIANICERKAQDVLIRAAAQVIKKHPAVYFELVGKEMESEKEYCEKVHALARDLDIQDHISFPGLVPFEDAMRRLADSDIFAFPTLSEMMPRAVIEAMMAGKPIIASSVDGILDLIHDRQTGLLVRPGNEEELVNALCELIENPDLSKSLGSASRDYVMNFCSPERVGRLFQGFYQSILDEKGK